MIAENKTKTILIADDDPDDQLMIKECFEEEHPEHSLVFVENGQELLDYLRDRGNDSSAECKPLPVLVILDLNMPKMDGREALREIKNDSKLNRIPVVILSTSNDEEDIYRSYTLGINSFICKPVSYTHLKQILKTVSQYWLGNTNLQDS